MSFSASIEQHISCEDVVKIAEEAGQKIMEVYNSPVCPESGCNGFLFLFCVYVPKKVCEFPLIPYVFMHGCVCRMKRGTSKEKMIIHL